MRTVVVIAAILNVLMILLCVVVFLSVGHSPEVPTWEYIVFIPALMTFVSPFLAVFPSVRNHTPTLALLVFGFPPFSLLLIPELFIRPDPPPSDTSSGSSPRKVSTTGDDEQ